MSALDEILAMMREFRSKVERAAQTIPDDDAEEMVELFPVWNPDKDYESGEKFQYLGHPYKVKDGKAHHSQADWTPDVAMSLYERIAHANETGEIDAPIVYNGNMELLNGKYYTQDGVTYRCTRDSGVALVHPLSQLIGLYVEMVA